MGYLKMLKIHVEQLMTTFDEVSVNDNEELTSFSRILVQLEVKVIDKE
jgi:hypothetical protein